jgi:hypothetical protein
MGLLKDSTKLREQFLSKNLYNYKEAYDLSKDAFTTLLNKSLSLGIELRKNIFIDTIERITDNTPLVRIGYIQLAKHMKNKVADEILSELDNVTPTTLNFRNISTFKNKDFKITPYVNQNISEKLINKLLGYTSDDNLPKLRKDNDFFVNLGSYQKNVLIKNISENRFYNPIFDKSITERPKQIQNFVYSDEYLNEGNYTYQANVDFNFEKDIQVPSDVVIPLLDKLTIEGGMGFGKTMKENSSNLSDEERYLFYGLYGDTTLNNDFKIRRGLLYYTSKIIQDSVINNTTTKNFDGLNIEYYEDENGETIWRGASECRSFTIADQYDRYERLIRYEGNNNEYSVLRDSVMPKIFFKNNDTMEEKKRVSFSIENLAVNTKRIHDCEIGPNGGRLLWFVPYDLKISDNNTINWESKDIVGRIEKLYSYTNTDRRLSLSFKLLMDFPPQFNEYFNKNSGNYSELVSYIQGCVNTQIDIPDDLTEEKDNKEGPKLPKKNVPNINEKPTIYFDNDIDTINETISANYEFTGNGLNKDYRSDVVNLADKIIEAINVNNKKLKINILGQASSLYLNDYNAALALRRCNALMFDIIKEYNISKEPKPILDKIQLGNFSQTERFDGTTTKSIKITKDEFDTLITLTDEKGLITFTLQGFGEERSNTTQNIPINATDSKIKEILDNPKAKRERNARVSDINFVGDIIVGNQPTVVNSGTTTANTVTLGVNKPQVRKIPCDIDYLDFQARAIDTKIKSAFDNINYFAPVFHSQTPYDFVKRYLFLQQITRPGSTEDRINQIGGNSVFGKMPVIVIKLYDFIYSKAICSSINFSFDDATWDFNPEGMGAIPMSCSVTMDMALIGGQSLSGPIDKLQTADDFNFLATSTYESDDDYYESYSTWRARRQETQQNKLNEARKKEENKSQKK